MEPRKITLTELAAYLPYRMQFIVEVPVWEGNPPEPSHMIEQTETLTVENIAKCLQFSICPILRPLTDLVKHVDLPGHENMTVAAKEIWPLGLKEDYGFEMDFIMPKEWNDKMKQTPIPYIWAYHEVESMLEYHFDVFGLIEAGLAIDINTIKK